MTGTATTSFEVAIIAPPVGKLRALLLQTAYAGPDAEHAVEKVARLALLRVVNVWQSLLCDWAALVRQVQASDAEIRTALQRYHTFLIDGRMHARRVLSERQPGHYRIMSVEYEAAVFERLMGEIEGLKVCDCRRDARVMHRRFRTRRYRCEGWARRCQTCPPRCCTRCLPNTPSQPRRAMVRLPATAIENRCCRRNAHTACRHGVCAGRAAGVPVLRAAAAQQLEHGRGAVPSSHTPPTDRRRWSTAASWSCGRTARQPKCIPSLPISRRLGLHSAIASHALQGLAIINAATFKKTVKYLPGLRRDPTALC